MEEIPHNQAHTCTGPTLARDRRRRSKAPPVASDTSGVDSRSDSSPNLDPVPLRTGYLDPEAPIPREAHAATAQPALALAHTSPAHKTASRHTPRNRPHTPSPNNKKTKTRPKHGTRVTPSPTLHSREAHCAPQHATVAPAPPRGSPPHHRWNEEGPAHGLAPALGLTPSPLQADQEAANRLSPGSPKPTPPTTTTSPLPPLLPQPPTQKQ